MHKIYQNYNTMLTHLDSAQIPLQSSFEVLVDVDYKIIKEFLAVDEPEKEIFFFHKDHLGSSTQITDMGQHVIHHIEYMPTGEQFLEQRDYWHTPYRFNGKELDEETGLYYYGARYYTPELGIWLSVDPLSDKYPSLSPFMYCAGNPVVLVDPDGREWVDAQGNKITDHSNIKVYIFYDPKSFSGQSKQMYKDALAKYGEGSVAMSNVTTMSEFAKDWGDMASGNIKEVNLNYHGNNQTVMLNSDKKQYITATGDGKTNVSGTKATNVQDLPTPKGSIDKAQLNLNTCKSNSTTQHPLKGNGKTLMETFYNSFDFKTVRGTSSGVSYERTTKQPFPGRSWWRGTWDYMKRPAPQPIRYRGSGLPPK